MNQMTNDFFRFFIPRAALLSLLVLIPILNLQAKTLEKARSIYRNIVVDQSHGKRCMRFETRRKKIANQACIDVNHPDRLVFEYTQSILSGLAYQPKPKEILIIGLGGGLLPRAFSQVIPSANVTSVEIDPVVVKLAKKYFYYSESPKIKTIIRDGRVFIKRAKNQTKRYDWIILDAFNGDYIPEHLLTKEFLQEAKDILSPDGILTANTFSNSRLYDHESVTYQSVFGSIKTLRSPTKGNRIIFGCNCEKWPLVNQIDSELVNKLEPVGVDIQSAMRRLSDKVDWDTSVKILTDQYSPANLLN